MSSVTTGSVTAKLKAQENIAKFLQQIESANDGWDDDDRDEEFPIETFASRGKAYQQQDDKDGVNSRTVNELVAEHTARKLAMRKRFSRSQALFSKEEVAEDSVIEVVDLNDINRRLKWGYTPLIEAAVKGDYDECLRLKEAHADLTLRDNSHKQAWQKARDRGYDDIADLLIC